MSLIVRMGINARRIVLLRCTLVFSVIALVPLSGYAQSSLDRYNIASNSISVSGLSSGAFMAVQLHVAFSKTFMGVGVLGGGPYYCAEGMATGRCMADDWTTLPPASHFRDLTEIEAAAGRIDLTSNMAGDRVWLFTGGADVVVLSRVMDRLKDYYGFYTATDNILYETIPNAQHAMITEEFGNACSFKGDPYINDCDYGAAKELLSHIYGTLNSATTAPESNLKTFDQTEFSRHETMSSQGYIYVPTGCEDGATPCKLHVALHGCFQNEAKVGDTFAKHAGYNELAEANNIIVLYPQTSLRAFRQCWDWWGYTEFPSEKRYHTKVGTQTVAVKAMLDRVMGVPSVRYCESAKNSSHADTRRAYRWSWWWFWPSYFATGSNEYLGWRGSTTTVLRETSPGYYENVSSCP
jgi:poly(3-hydroxybutyrate) depolymerase